MDGRIRKRPNHNTRHWSSKGDLQGAISGKGPKVVVMFGGARGIRRALRLHHQQNRAGALDRWLRCEISCLKGVRAVEGSDRRHGVYGPRHSGAPGLSGPSGGGRGQESRL